MARHKSEVCGGTCEEVFINPCRDCSMEVTVNDNGGSVSKLITFYQMIRKGHTRLTTTVKPVDNRHLGEKSELAVVERWLLKKRSPNSPNRNETSNY
jgi:hypothetical protein